MNISKTYQRNIGALLASMFLFFAYNLCLGSNSFPGDSTKIKYDINDPRNPDCPCHKYQKLADDEYAKIIGKENGVSLGESKSNEIGIARESKINTIEIAGNKKKTSFFHFRYKRTNSTSHIIKKKKLKRFRIFKRRRGPDDCFSWK